MDVTYSVTWKQQVVGEVSLHPDGLYCNILCTCKLPEGGIYRLWMSASGEGTNLGVLYPGSGFFSLRRRVPGNLLAKENPVFRIELPQKQMRFVPVRADEPFPYLHLLMQGRFAVQDGVPGLLIPTGD